MRSRVFLLVLLVMTATIPARAGVIDDGPRIAAPRNVETSAPGNAEKDAAALRTMIGQMIIVGFPGSSPKEGWPRLAAGMIRAGKIGGVILFSHNVRGPAQLAALTASLYAASPGLAPFVMVDQEGGQIRRLTVSRGFVGLPSARRIAVMDQGAAYRLYRKTAQELAELGINVNLGPVVDLDIYTDSPAIGRKARSYGTDPKTVVAYARQFIDAHGQAGLLTAAKHFPGHGSAREDPHLRPVNIAATWREPELDPFRTLIDEHFVDMVMVGHLYHPRFSDGDLPTSLSKRTVTEVLRKELGYDGLIVTDDLDMGAVRDRFSIEEAAVMAVAAGADLLIVSNQLKPDPTIVERVTTAIAAAAARGEIRRETIEDSYARIVRAKNWLAERRAHLETAE